MKLNVSAYGEKVREGADVVRAINHVVLVLAVIAVCAGVWGVVVRGAPFAFTPATASVGAADAAQAPAEAQPLGEYLSPVQGKQVFAEGKAPVNEPAAARVQRLTAQELASPLSLIGILAGDDPVAFIEDTRTKKTMSLKTGEYINDLLIEAIGENSVTLMYQGETLELKL